MSALTIARTELLRMFRERSNLFFVFVFPLLLVVLIGASFGGAAEQRVGVVAPGGDAEAQRLVDHLDGLEGVATVAVDSADDLREQVSRGLVAAGVIVPRDAGADLTAGRGPVEVTFVARGDGRAFGLRSMVDEAITERAAVVDAARLTADAVGGRPEEHLALAEQVAPNVPQVQVRTEEVGGDDLAREFQGLGQFDLGASTQLFLFTFLTSLTASAAMIESRRLGVTQRMLVGPTSTGQVIAGFAGGRILIALIQAAYIVVATVLLFRVDWGAPAATAAVIVLFCIVAAGAGMLLGATMRNDAQAGGAGVGLGLGLAALGGSMVPLEVFPEAMRLVARVTPHAWANEAMAEIVRRDGGVRDVATQLAALGGFAVALFGLATWRLRRAMDP